jgi:hypothetical protein
MYLTKLSSSCLITLYIVPPVYLVPYLSTKVLRTNDTVCKIHVVRIDFRHESHINDNGVLDWPMTSAVRGSKIL